MIQLGISLSPLLTLGALGGGGTTPPPPAGAYYPDVPPVDLAAATGSFDFPERNNSAAQAKPGLSGYRALFAQSRANYVTLASTVPQAVFAIVRLPKGQRQENNFWGILGNTGSGGYRQWLRYNGDGMSSYGGRFRFYQCGNGGGAADLYSAPWTEESALVVAWCNGANLWQLDWYSLIDGVCRPGTPVTIAVNGAGGQASFFNIGGAGISTSFAANGGSGSQWPGMMEAVGYLGSTSGTPPDTAAWSRIALGARLQDEIAPVTARFIRQLDGTPAGLTRPAWATGDTQPASTAVNGATGDVAGTTFAGGSTFRRQGTAQYLLFDPTPAGLVHGLTVGQTERAVPFAGIAAGFAGPVEIRVIEAATGKVVRNWTELGTPVAGRWSGSLMLPKSTGGWLFAEARARDLPTLVAHRRDHFAVGYKFMIMGQSQTQIGMFTGSALLPELVNPMTASYADLAVIGKRALVGAAARAPIMGRIGMAYASDGLVSFLNQFRRFDPTTPVMIYDDAVNGTSMEVLLSDGTDSGTDRHWADITDKLALWGNDVTAVLWNWLMNEGSPSGSHVQPLMTGMFLPGGVGNYAHSLVSELAPGWTLGVLGGDRESYVSNRQGMRTERIKFAHQNGFKIGPVVSDYRIEDAGGPHPGNHVHGPARFGQRMGVLAARVIGADASQNPYYRNARLDTGGTRILIDCVPVNGGTITSPAPTALRSWYIKEPSDTDFVKSITKGATAVLNGATVEITRASGAWPTGTQVMRMDDSEKRADGDGAAEDAIHAGGIYESWPLDPLGFGFPVVGSRDANGLWWNAFTATV